MFKFPLYISESTLKVKWQNCNMGSPSTKYQH